MLHIATDFYKDLFKKEEDSGCHLANDFFAPHEEITNFSGECPYPEPFEYSFRRSLNGNRWSLWLQLVQRLMHVQLNNENGKFVWGLTTSGGQYVVKSMYMDHQ
jgi:hypothetical protein